MSAVTQAMREAMHLIEARGEYSNVPSGSVDETELLILSGAEPQERTNLFGELHQSKADDVVYTPDWCAADMVRHFKPAGRILEPCRGAGAFMRHLPPETFWCEIAEGRDFFEWREPVDWIMTNPPYSATRPFFCHAKALAENIVFLLSVRNVFAGYGFVREVAGWGGMAEIRWYGRGSRLGFPMGNAVGAIHWKRGHATGFIRETFYEDDRLSEVTS